MLGLHVLIPAPLKVWAEMERIVEAIIDKRPGQGAREKSKSRVVRHNEPYNDSGGDDENAVMIEAKNDAELLVDEDMMVQVPREEFDKIIAVIRSVWIEMDLLVEAESMLLILDERPHEDHTEQTEVNHEVPNELLDRFRAAICISKFEYADGADDLQVMGVVCFPTHVFLEVLIKLDSVLVFDVARSSHECHELFVGHLTDLRNQWLFDIKPGIEPFVDLLLLSG